MARAAFLFILGLQLLPTVYSAAAVTEVIPGYGLPSLASLNLTSQDIHDMPFPFPKRSSVRSRTRSTSSIDKRFESICFPDYLKGVDSDLITCYKFLTALGTTSCGLSGGFGDARTVCTTGSSVAKTMIWSQGSEENSYCQDVATALLSTYASCGGNSLSGGLVAAVGNGNLVVEFANNKIGTCSL